MMLRRSTLPVMLVAVLALAACGSGTSKGGSTTTTILKLSSPSWETAKPYPSKSAKMICEKEVRGEIAVGARDHRDAVVPNWSKPKHLYSCSYIYPRGTIVLSVKELSNERETTAYFDAVKSKYGAKNPIVGLAQGGWLLKNDDVVARRTTRCCSSTCTESRPTSCTGSSAPASRTASQP